MLKEKKTIKQKNKAQNKLGCRDTLTEPPIYVKIYIDVRRGRKEGRKRGCR